MGAKLMAHKEREKKYKKIVDNPMLYLEERQHQILPEETPAGDPFIAVSLDPERRQPPLKSLLSSTGQPSMWR